MVEQGSTAGLCLLHGETITWGISPKRTSTSACSQHSLYLQASRLELPFHMCSQLTDKIWVSRWLYPPGGACRQCLAKADSLFPSMSASSAFDTLSPGVPRDVAFSTLSCTTLSETRDSLAQHDDSDQQTKRESDA